MDTHVDEARLAALLRRAGDLHRGAAHTSLRAARAETDADIASLQTAAALENLAVSFYTSALGLDAVRLATGSLRAFVTATRNQHADHAAAYNAAVTRAGGAVQTNPDPRYAALVQGAPFATVGDVVTLAAGLEDVATQTFVRSATVAGAPALRSLFVSVAAVEAQHRAVLLAVRDLLGTEPGAKVALPTALSRLHAAIGSAGFPDAVIAVTNASPSGEGAVR